MNNETFQIGDKVRPAANTRGGLTYGYVREAATHPQGPAVVVYWPEIQSRGVWPVRDLQRKGR